MKQLIYITFVALTFCVISFGQESKTCEQFIEKARSRYAQIGTGFRSSSKDRRPILQSAPKLKKAIETVNEL